MLHSLSAQVSYFSNYIQNHPGWEYAGVFVDEAITGTKEARPQFQRMLAECRAGKIDMILTKAISRFARNTITLLESVRELKSIGVDVYFEEQNIHTLSGAGELMLTVFAAFAQEESRSVSENCKWRIRHDFEKGRPTSRKVLGFSFKDGKYTPQPEEMDIVKRVFDDYLSGMGTVAISKKLQLSRNRISYLLRNEKYAGDLLLQKTYTADHISKKTRVNDDVLPMYYVRNSHIPIIDRARYDHVQAEIQRRARLPRPEYRTYAFTSMIRCGICGASYHRKMVGSSPKYRKPAWICTTFDMEGKAACASQQIPEVILEAKAAEALGIVFDEKIFRQKIKEIQVPAHNRLVFLFHDGTTETCEWQNPSRRDSWTPEMREQARQRLKERKGRL